MSTENHHIESEKRHISSNGFTEEMVAAAIAGVIGAAKAEGRSLEDVRQEVLSDDAVLDSPTRTWLSQVVSEAWNTMPENSPESLPHSA